MDTNNDAHRVNAVVNEFASAWNRHDMQAFGDLFTPDAEFVNVVGIWWKGRTEIQKAHQFAHSTMFKASRLVLLETTVRFYGLDVAVSRSKWSLEGHLDPDGKALPPRTGILLNVLVAGDTGWKIAESQNTDIIEGALSRPQ
jgi:uncharacterized protein (TIGR02246 family)